jgi:recombination protein RecR
MKRIRRSWWPPHGAKSIRRRPRRRASSRPSRDQRGGRIMFTGPLRTLIDELGRLPGIGPKSAQRIAFHILKVPSEDAHRLSDAIVAVKERTTLCDVLQRGRGWCVCASAATTGARRPFSAWSRTRATSWRWSAPGSSTAATTSSGGALNPARGGRAGAAQGARAPDPHRRRENQRGHRLHQPQSRRRGDGDVRGPPPDAPRRRGVALASGLPVGGDLEYADELTLGRALEGRRTLEV